MSAKVAVAPAGSGAQMSAAEPVGGDKAIDFKSAPANDPLMKRLQAWDTNGDGMFSPEEVLAAAREVGMSELAQKQAETMTKRMAFVAFALGFLLLCSIGANFASTMYAINLSKEESVPETSGVMLTKPYNSSGDAPLPHPVGTASVNLKTDGISGLKESTKEELDALGKVNFYHDGGYHIISVSQVHRYDGRVEIWGNPVGVVVVEDTGEVHYAPYAIPGATITADNGTDNVTAKMDECWGENSTIDMEEVCGEAVDNEPPSNLEVESPIDDDPENMAAPPGARRLIGIDGEGELLYEEDNEHMAEARRLSGRRRSGGTSYSSSSRRRATSSSSRRRSGGSTSSRRRSSGGYSSPSASYAPTDARRRSTTPARRRAAPPPPASGRRRVPARVDASSRRRAPNYYGTPSDSRRRSMDSSTVAAGAGGLAAGAAVGGLAGYAAGGGFSPSPSSGGGTYYAGSGSSVNTGGQSASVGSCPSGMHQECSGASCWCDENTAGLSGWVSIFVVGGICFCCCVFGMFAGASK